MGALLMRVWRSCIDDGEQLNRPESKRHDGLDAIPPAVDDQDDSETYTILKELRDYVFEGRECGNVENIAFIRDGSLRRALRDILIEHYPNSASTVENAVSSRGPHEQLRPAVPVHRHAPKAKNNTIALSTEFHEIMLTEARKIDAWLNMHLSDPELAGMILYLIRKVLQESVLVQLGSLPWTELNTAMAAVTKEVRDCLEKYRMGALLRKAWRSSRSERVQLMRLEPEHDARFHSVPSAVDDQDDSETYAIVKKLRNYAFRGQEAPGVERIAFIRNGSLRKALRDILQEHCPESASPAAREGASSSGRSGGAKGAQYYGACDIPKELHPDFDDTTAVGAKASENTAPSRGAREPAQQQFVHPVLLSKRRIGVWLNLNMPDPEITGIIFCLMKKALQESELMQLGSLPFTEFDTAMHEVTKEVRDCLGKYGLTS